jgi:fucose permease
MNLLHFFYGLGASIGPRYSGQMISMGFVWNDVYFYSLALVAVLFIFTVLVKPPERKNHGHEEKIPLKDILKDKRAILFGTSMGFYVACELGVANWFVNYLTVVYKMSELQGSTMLSLFFITFTAGRLVGGFIAERLGYFKSVLIFLGTSLILFTGGILLGRQYVFLISFCGLAFSIVFPTLTTIVIGEFRKSTGSILGFIITMSSVINMFSNWIIGKINDSIGVDKGFMIIGVYIVIAIVLVIILKRTVPAREEASVKLAD